MNDYNDIFAISKKMDKRPTPREYWKITFRHDNSQFKTAQSEERAKALAFNWVNDPKNAKVVVDLVAEVSLLLEAPEGFDPSSLH